MQVELAEEVVPLSHVILFHRDGQARLDIVSEQVVPGPGYVESTIVAKIDSPSEPIHLLGTSKFIVYDEAGDVVKVSQLRCGKMIVQGKESLELTYILTIHGVQE